MPERYRMLAYYFAFRGYDIDLNMPGDDRPETAKEVMDGAFDWLRSAPQALGGTASPRTTHTWLPDHHRIAHWFYDDNTHHRSEQGARLRDRPPTHRRRPHCLHRLP
jgi:hypothetical protein